MPEYLLSASQVQDLSFAALYHDLGKLTWLTNWHIKSRKNISNQEWTKMQMHPIQSVNILEKLNKLIPGEARRYILEHHERPGGKGYPYGIEPDFHSLILAAADVYSACTEI